MSFRKRKDIKTINPKEEVRIMKKMLQVLCVVMLLASLVVVGCGKADPKALAKEMVDILMAGQDLNENDEAASQKLMDKLAKLEKKGQGLSEADQAIFQQELERLMAENNPFGLINTEDEED